jgi:competence protein ComEC
VPVKVVAAGHHPDSLQPAAGRVLLYWAAKDSSRIPHYGDLLGVRARVEPTRPPANPHAFDYQRYLFHQNIHHQAFVAADSLVFLSSGHGTWWWNAAYTARDQVLALLRQHFPTPDAYAVAAALLVGYKDELSDELREAYTDTGSIHALVVSGSHVSALMVFLALLLNKLPIYGRKSQWVKFLIGIPLIWSFALLTGASASVIRAVVMFSIYLLGNALWRDTNGWNILAGSALILLFFQPAWMFDPGFQLSYSAVAGMLFFYPRFNRLIPVLPKWANYLMDPLLLGCAAQLGTLPLSLYYSHIFIFI